MPQVYYPQPEPEPRRRRSTSSASSASISSDSTGSIRPTDADDSIILSDLVRTGEASRLRRRGAMRIDHGAINSTNSHPYNSVRRASPTMLTPDRDRPTWDSDYDPDSQPVLEGHFYRNPQARFSRIRPRSSRRYEPHDTLPYIHVRDHQDEYVYALVCGAKITNLDLDDEIEPFKPSILPLYPPSASSSNKTIVHRNTGCGTIVHMHAAPRPRVGMWTARSVASGSVVTLDASYFDTQEAAKFTRNACGCVKEGVGCAICGNPLGIRYIPCKAASDSLFLPCNNRKLYGADVSNRLRGPEGPQYWRASSSQPSTDHAIHTFFPHAVTSIPHYDFPPTKPVARRRAYSDESIELISSPPTVTQVFASDNERDIYENTEETPDWRLLGEEYTRDTEFTPRNYPNEEENTDVPHPAMILDRFSASSPISFSEADDGNVSPTTPTANRGSWGSPAGYLLRHHTRTAITPTSRINFRSHNHDNNEAPQQSFYQQQVLGAWEREQEAEEMDRARNVHHDGRSVIDDVRWGWGLDPDGESEVRGVVDAGESWATDPYDSESADKSTEGFLFPER